jgi:hypothetical protein
MDKVQAASNTNGTTNVTLTGREGRSRRRLKLNTKMKVTEMECEVVHLVQLSQDRGHWWALVNMTIHHFCFS